MLWASELRIWSSCRHRRDIPLRLCCLPATYQEGYSPHCSADPPLSTSHSLWFLFLSHCAEITSSLDFWNWKPRQEVCCKIPSFQLATFFCLLDWKRKGDEAGGNKNINIFKKSRTPKKNPRTALSRVSSLPSTHRQWQFLSPMIAGIFYLRSAVAVSSWGQRKCLQVQICIYREFHDCLYYRGEVGWG